MKPQCRQLVVILIMTSMNNLVLIYWYKRFLKNLNTLMGALAYVEDIMCDVKKKKD